MGLGSSSPPSFDVVEEVSDDPRDSRRAVRGNYNVRVQLHVSKNFAANGFVVLVTNPRRPAPAYGSDFHQTASTTTIQDPTTDDLMAGVGHRRPGKGAYVDNLADVRVGAAAAAACFRAGVIGPHRSLRRGGRCGGPGDRLAEHGRDTRTFPLFTYSFFKKPFWEDPSDWAGALVR